MDTKQQNARRRGFIPGLLLTSGILFFFIMLVFPLGEVIYRSLKDGFAVYASAVTAKNTLSALKVLSALIDIPFSISPVIAGLAYIMTFGRMGWAAPFIDWLNGLLGTDISFVFSIPGVVLATVFVTFPFVSRELIPVMQAQGSSEEEAAVMMGAKGLYRIPQGDVSAY